MPQNSIDFPDGLYDRVRAAANTDRRSIQAQVLTLLEEALNDRQARASFAANSGPNNAHRVTVLDTDGEEPRRRPAATGGRPVASNPLDDLDAQERAGVTAIWLVPDTEERPGYVALETLGGMKPYARVWLRTMTSPDPMERVDWGHHIADDAVCVWADDFEPKPEPVTVTTIVGPTGCEHAVPITWAGPTEDGRPQWTVLVPASLGTGPAFDREDGWKLPRDQFADGAVVDIRIVEKETAP